MCVCGGGGGGGSYQRAADDRVRLFERSAAEGKGLAELDSTFPASVTHIQT